MYTRHGTVAAVVTALVEASVKKVGQIGVEVIVHVVPAGVNRAHHQIASTNQHEDKHEHQVE